MRPMKNFNLLQYQLLKKKVTKNSNLDIVVDKFDSIYDNKEIIFISIVRIIC